MNAEKNFLPSFSMADEWKILKKVSFCTPLERELFCYYVLFCRNVDDDDDEEEEEENEEKIDGRKGNLNDEVHITRRK
jgi:hypothetical protein